MSYTEIYKFDKDGNSTEIGSVKNATRSSLAIWKYLGNKYLPNSNADWNSPMAVLFHGQSVWRLYTDRRLSAAERNVLGATLDKAICLKDNLSELIESFRTFDADTSLKEQALILEEALKDDTVFCIGFNQNSVSGWINDDTNIFKTKGVFDLMTNMDLTIPE